MEVFQFKSPTCINPTGSAKHFFYCSAAAANISCETARDLPVAHDQLGAQQESSLTCNAALSHVHFDDFCKGREQSWETKVFNSSCLNQHNQTTFVLIVPNYDLEQYKFPVGCKSAANLHSAGGVVGSCLPSCGRSSCSCSSLGLGSIQSETMGQVVMGLRALSGKYSCCMSLCRDLPSHVNTLLWANAPFLPHITPWGEF